MKSLTKRTHKRNNQLRRFVCIFFAVNCLIEFPLKVACVGMEETVQNRSRRQAGRLPIKWAGPHHIYVTVNIGSDDQQFNLVLDTFFDTTFVVSTDASSPAWAQRRRFDADKSTTFQQSGGHIVDSHHVQSFYGYIALETIKLGGLALHSFPFRLITILPDTTTFPDNMDGVLGLSYGTYTEGTDLSLPDVLSQALGAASSIFGIKLCPASGLLTVGYECHECYSGNMHELRVHYDGKHWMAQVTQITYNGRVWKGVEADAFFHTGCGWIQGPEDTIKALNEKLGFNKIINGTYYVGSGLPRRLPRVGFTTDGEYNFELKAEDYYRMEDKDGKLQFYSVFRSTGVKRNFWIFGLPLLRGRYITFNKQLNRIGFAKAKCF